MALSGDVWRNLEDGHNGQCDCDNCDQPAVGRICVEADSFGAEWAHYCEKHLAIAEAKAKEPLIGNCDWCKAVDIEIFPTRDTDEGSHGPVYDVCKCCRQKQAKRDVEEFKEWTGQHDSDDDDYDALSDLYSEAENDKDGYDPDDVIPIKDHLKEEAIMVMQNTIDAIDNFKANNPGVRVFVARKK